MKLLGEEKLNAHGEAMQFQNCLPMRFRLLGEKVWRDASAYSMSLTEIVFRGDEAIGTGKTLDIRLVLPQSGSGRWGGTIVSKAKVTRSWTLSDTPGQVFIAAALIGPHLRRLSPESGRRE